MEKRKIFPRLFAALVILTLVSCCFLGSTFARYTTSSSGTAQVQVAKWYIDVTGGGTEESTDIEFSKLSPSMDAYDSAPRTNTTDYVLVATIENKSDVDAKLNSLTADNIAITKIEEASYGTTGIASEAAPTEAEVKDVFSIELFISETEGTQSLTAFASADESLKTIAKKTGKLYIYAQVTWTSDDKTITGTTADKRDTWIGENVTAVTWALSYTAVQASELPEP